MDRREFLQGTGWMGLAAVAAGCLGRRGRFFDGASMQGFRCAPLSKICVGLVGCGQRGMTVLGRLPQIPGVEIVAFCDLHAERPKVFNRWMSEHGYPTAKEYAGAEAYKALCESDLDVVYVTTGWDLHVPVGVYAMEHGKHALIEVPSANTLDECWQLVETAERTRRHCMQLENCCYGEAELLCLNLCRLGVLGEIVHGEAAYVHDLRELCHRDPIIEKPSWEDTGYENYWRLRYNVFHKGNHYETHGLGPVAKCMNINRGDRFDCICSLESNQNAYELYAGAHFSKEDWRARQRIDMGDINTSVIRTVRGRTILLQHDVSSPRPYTRHNLISGTRGVFQGIDFAEKPEDALTNGNICRFAWEDRNGAGVHEYFGFDKTNEMRAKYAHPLWKKAGQVAAKVGGHGGMDFLMDLRWAYCLQNGLPLDTDVYDLAAWCAVGELSERCVRGRRIEEFPDFTRGGWKTAAAFGVKDIDMRKMNFKDVRADDHALRIS